MTTRDAIPVLLLLTLSFAPASAHAEDSQARAPGTAPARNAQARRDPLWNGIVLGGSLGALLGAFVGTAAIDCQECAGYNVTATFAAIGAGAGIGLGAGIDAMRAVTSAAGRSRFQLTPIVAKGTRGITGRIRF